MPTPAEETPLPLPDRIAAVLLDMDGTLVDSDAVVARVWDGWSRLRGVDRARVARVTPGRPAVESLAELAPWLDPQQRRADAEALLAQERRDLDGITPMPGALHLLAALRAWDLPHAVVTSADAALARGRLGAAGIALPDVLVTADGVWHGKPSPEGFLLAAERLGAPIGDCLVVEDSPAGVRAGLAAGAVVVAVRPVPGAHLTVPDLGALLDLLTARRPAGRPGKPVGGGRAGPVSCGSQASTRPSPASLRKNGPVPGSGRPQ